MRIVKGDVLENGCQFRDSKGRWLENGCQLRDSKERCFGEWVPMRDMGDALKKWEPIEG